MLEDSAVCKDTSLHAGLLLVQVWTHVKHAS